MPTQTPVVLVTGAARRIGAAIARRLHAAGYSLAIHYRGGADAAQALQAELELLRPDSVLLLQAELAQLERVPGLVEATVSRFGRLDALVNNASAFYPTPIGAATPAMWDELFASNARAPFFLAQAAAPHLRASRGAIVNLLDIHAERPLREHTVYVMAKAALEAMTRSLALELAPEVRVNGLALGAVLWPEQGRTEQQKAALLEATPLGRAGSAEEVAEAVRWLLQEASYCTGQVLRLDGGRSLA
ncbi:MAG: pteridine reductase [Arenimonas sp.]